MEFSIDAFADLMSSNMIDHGEHWVPYEVVPLVLQEQCHVEGRCEGQFPSIRQIPCVMEDLRSRQLWDKMAVLALQVLREEVPVFEVVVYWVRG